MATGMASWASGGGAMIGSPLSVALMDHYKTATSVGGLGDFVAMGLIYFVFMLWGVVMGPRAPGRLGFPQVTSRRPSPRNWSPRVM